MVSMRAVYVSYGYIGHAKQAAFVVGEDVQAPIGKRFSRQMLIFKHEILPEVPDAKLVAKMKAALEAEEKAKNGACPLCGFRHGAPGKDGKRSLTGSLGWSCDGVTFTRKGPLA